VSSKPHFTELLQQWSQQNKTQDFADFLQEVRPLVQSLPMIILNLDAVITSLLKHATKPQTMASEPILMLIGALARDVRGELTPYFGRIFATMVSLLDVAARVGEQNAELLEQVFQCLAFLFKYLARYVAKDLPSYLESYSTLLRHPTTYLRHFAGETLAYILRRVRSTGVNVAIRDLCGLLHAGLSTRELASMADGLGVVLFEASKSLQHRFHSQMPTLLDAVLDIHVYSVQANETSPLLSTHRWAQLWTAKATILRMRNHAASISGAGDILEIVFEHFDNVVHKYELLLSADGCCSSKRAAAASEDVDSGAVTSLAVASDEPPPSQTSAGSSQSQVLAVEQAILFYIDLLVSWVYTKPQQSMEGPDWTAFVEAILSRLTKLVPLARATKTSFAGQEISAEACCFPPTSLSLLEALLRMFVLLWRAMPSLVHEFCNSSLVELLLGRPTCGPSIEENAMSMLADACVPDFLADLGATPFLPRVLRTTLEIIERDHAGQSDFRLAAVSLCRILLQNAAASCVAESVGALNTGAARSKLLGHLLRLSEAACMQAQQQVAPQDQLLLSRAAACSCTLSLFQACSRKDLHLQQNDDVGLLPEKVPERLAWLVARSKCLQG